MEYNKINNLLLSEDNESEANETSEKLLGYYTLGF